jgi:AMMECR1 domain-containing protein
MLSEKAGASAEMWREPETEVYVYQVEVFEEHAAHA